jgi:hypothetical protein
MPVRPLQEEYHINRSAERQTTARKLLSLTGGEAIADAHAQHHVQI